MMQPTLLGEFPADAAALDAGAETHSAVLYGDRYDLKASHVEEKRRGLLGFFSRSKDGLNIEVRQNGDLLDETTLTGTLDDEDVLWASVELLADAHHARDPNDAVRRLVRAHVAAVEGQSAEHDTHILGADYTLVTVGQPTTVERDGLGWLLKWKEVTQPGTRVVLFRGGDKVEQFVTGDLAQRVYLDGGLSRLPVFADETDIRDQLVEDIREFGVLARVRDHRRQFGGEQR